MAIYSLTILVNVYQPWEISPRDPRFSRFCWWLVGLHSSLLPPTFDSSLLSSHPDIVPLTQTKSSQHNMLEALSFEVGVNGYESKDLIGSIIRNVENVLVRPGWPALKQVSLKVSIELPCCLYSREKSAEMSEPLQSLPNEYLGPLSQLESIVFNFSASIVKCKDCAWLVFFGSLYLYRIYILYFLFSSFFFFFESLIPFSDLV